MFTVLGAAGFIGSSLVQALRASGEEVCGAQRGDPGVFSRDLGHVICCIGVTADFRTRPWDTVRAHVCAVTEVLERCRFSSFLYLSSTRVYAKSMSGREDAALAVDPSDPDDLYNLSKLMGESVTLSCRRSNTRVVRLSNVYGKGQSENFLGSILNEVRSGRAVVLQTAAESAKDYVSVDDVVDLLPQIALRGSHRIYNVGSGVNVTHRALLDRLTALTGVPWHAADSAPVTRFPQIDIQRVQQEFQFAPSSLLDDLEGMLHPIQ